MNFKETKERKIYFIQGINSNQRHRQEANARERVRTNRYFPKLTKDSLPSVNLAFTVLRNLIPTEPTDRKLSKIEILRLACSYISHLGSILVQGSCEGSQVKVNLKNNQFPQRTQICTFCVAFKKKE